MRSGVAIAALVGLNGGASAAEPSAQQPFGIRETIEYGRIVDLDDGVDGAHRAVFFAPDRSRFVILVEHGDLEADAQIVRMLLFRVADVERYLQPTWPIAPPAARELAKFPIRDEWQRVSHVSWIDNDRVVFLAPAADGVNQVFSVSLSKDDLSQLSHSPTDVMSFDIAQDTLLYWAAKPVDHPNSVSGHGKALLQIVNSGEPDRDVVELYQESLSSGNPIRIDAPAARLQEPFRRIWLSPSARYAITMTPATRWPPSWAAFRVPDPRFFAFTAENAARDPTSFGVSIFHRYQVVDLSTGAVRPLLDAPDGWLVDVRRPLKVWWAGEESVIVTNTFLPLDVADLQVRKQREVHPATAEIDLRSGRIATIAYDPNEVEKSSSAKVHERIVSMDWNARRKALTIGYRKTDSRRAVAGAISYARFEKRNAYWQRRTIGSSPAPDPAVRIFPTQGLNERQKLYAASRSCSCQKEIHDPNPQAEQLTFAKAEIVHWQDASGLRWTGGLIVPPDYVAGRRYPLIVQTHDFHPDEFLVDGPEGMHTAFAAQAFANSGFVVLQAEQNNEAGTADEREAILNAQGLKAGIEKLVAEGIVDAARVGIIGFSHTGFHVMKVMTLFPGTIAAATLADSGILGYTAAMIQANLPSWYANQVLAAMGIDPAQNGPEAWFRHSQTSELVKVATPIRYEAMGATSLFATWEAYAIGRASGRPVDVHYFPDGSHVLFRPRQRLASQGGNLDWFRFWLQGYEDPAEEKAVQYANWRELRNVGAVTSDAAVDTASHGTHPLKNPFKTGS